jgi:hypothetical protein
MGEKVKTENTEKKQEDKRKSNPHLFKPGQSGNPNGRPKGALNFSTKWVKFIEKIAEQNETTPDKVDEQMLKVAYKQIMSGDHRYWKDIMDRVYGQAKQNINVDGKVEINEETKRKTNRAIQEVIGSADTGRGEDTGN